MTHPTPPPFSSLPKTPPFPSSRLLPLLPPLPPAPLLPLSPFLSLSYSAFSPCPRPHTKAPLPALTSLVFLRGPALSARRRGPVTPPAREARPVFGLRLGRRGLAGQLRGRCWGRDLRGGVNGPGGPPSHPCPPAAAGVAFLEEEPAWNSYGPGCSGFLKFTETRATSGTPHCRHQ